MKLAFLLCVPIFFSSSVIAGELGLPKLERHFFRAMICFGFVGVIAS
jgi:hypothetical protein